MRRHAALFATLAVLTAAALGTGIASARPSSTKSDRDKVRAAKAEVAGNIDVLKADRAQLEQALDVLRANVSAEEDRLADAQRAVDAAQAQIDAAEQGIRDNTKRLATLRKVMAERAVEAYVAPNDKGLDSLLDSADASDAALRVALQGLQADSDAGIAEQIRGVQAGLESDRVAAQEARARAKAKRAEVANRVAKVKAAKSKQQKVVDGVQSRIDGQIARAIELSKQDRALSVKLAKEQALLAARLAAARAAAKPTSSGSGYGDGGSENDPVVPPGGITGGGTGSGGTSLCTVGGITVNCQISDQLQRMLTAAAGDGVGLSGGGYRDPAQQIELRKQHCGTSTYAIYQMSPSACHPPTARPGQSMHELGLAIDFNNCSSRGTACYGWLRGHAAGFGFYNLPSEPWHWSVNGN